MQEVVHQVKHPGTAKKTADPSRVGSVLWEFDVEPLPGRYSPGSIFVLAAVMANSEQQSTNSNPVRSSPESALADDD